MTDTTAPAVTTTVRVLTPLNVRAIAEIGVAAEVGKTYATFNGTAAEAVNAIQAAVTPDTKNSLGAVVRKLASGKNVTVTEAPVAEAAEIPAEDDPATYGDDLGDLADLAAFEAEGQAETADDAPEAEAAEVPAPEAETAPVDATGGQVVMATADGGARATRALVVTTDGATARVWFPQLGGPDSRAVQTVTAVTRPRPATEVSKSWVRRAARALAAAELGTEWAPAAEALAAADTANRAS